MPFLMVLGMGIAAFAAAVTALLVPLALVGLMPLTIDGAEAEFGSLLWLSGVLLFTVVGVLMGAIAYGFRNERLWVRPLPVYWWVGSALMGGVAAVSAPAAERGEWLGLVFQSLLFGGIALWYFYGKSSVREYYATIARREREFGSEAAAA